MTEASNPASPAEDLAARRAWKGSTLAGGTLTPELVAFCQMGVSIIVGTCSGGRPIAGRGFACRIDERGTIRILLRRTGHVDLLEAFRSGSPIAVTFTNPSRHRSIQFKGVGARESVATVADGMALAVQCREFRDRLVGIQYSEMMSNGYCFADCDDVVAIEFVPDEAFVQTPGPSAGTELQA